MFYSVVKCIGDADVFYSVVKCIGDADVLQCCEMYR